MYSHSLHARDHSFSGSLFKASSIQSGKMSILLIKKAVELLLMLRGSISYSDAIFQAYLRSHVKIVCCAISYERYGLSVF